MFNTVLYGKTIPENSKKHGKIPKMGVRRALRARRTPIFGIFPEFSGIFRLDFFSVQYCNERAHYCRWEELMAILGVFFQNIGQNGRPGRRDARRSTSFDETSRMKSL